MVKPSILHWHAIFAYSVAAMSFGTFIVLSLAVASANPYATEPARFLGNIGCYGAMLVPTAMAYAMVPLLPPRPWAWVVNVMALALTLPSLCLLPAALPLMVGFFRDDVKAWYGRS